MSDFLRPHGLSSARILCPWDFPGKNTGVGCPSLLQGIFPTQGSNPGLLHCRWILYWQPPGKPYWEKYMKQVFSGMEQYWVVCGSNGSMWGKLHIFPGLLSRRNQGIVEQRPTESWAEETEVRIWGCIAAEICGTQCIREEGSEQRLQKPLKWLPRVLHNAELCLHMTRFLEAQQSTITQEQIVS